MSQPYQLGDRLLAFLVHKVVPVVPESIAAPELAAKEDGEKR
ncbi:MAG: hypothetical protein ACYST0_10070 [Planctomycetota bacterium]|jgi:hypothetical protein